MLRPPLHRKLGEQGCGGLNESAPKRVQRTSTKASPAARGTELLMEIFATQDTASKIGSGIGALIAIGVYCFKAYGVYLGLVH
jgi:hypothetical protein